jgi:DNA-binding MarR family transcriptional regulator
MNQELSGIFDGVAIPMAYKLSYVTNGWREPSFRAIEAKLGLTRPEILSLIVLCFEDGIVATDICDVSGHLKTNISRAVTALETKGLLTRAPHADDQRMQVLRVTKKGRALHDRFMPGLQAREADMMACLSASEKTQFAKLLRKVCANAPEWNNLALRAFDDQP